MGECGKKFNTNPMIGFGPCVLDVGHSGPCEDWDGRDDRQYRERNNAENCVRLRADLAGMTERAEKAEARAADLDEAVALLRYFVDWAEGPLRVVAEYLPSDPDLVARRADIEGARAFLSRHPAPEVGS